MDWTSILLLILFFVLPLIQQVLEARKGKAPPGEDVEGGVGVEEAERPARTSRGGEGAGGWSDEWAPWPSSETEDTAAEEVEGWREEPVHEPRAWQVEPPRTVHVEPAEAPPAREPVPISREPAPYLPLPEPPTWSPQPTSVEPLPGAGASSHPSRFPITPLAVGERVEALPELLPVVRAHRSAHEFPGLASTAQIRHAIVLSEILGPPISLRTPPTQPG